MNSPTEKICIVCQRTFPKEIRECPDDRVLLTERDARIGTIFDGKYEILDFIGAGGLSRVYKARHVELNRILALKILKSSELIDLQRFRREAISIGQLDHPNIARVFSFAVTSNGSPYMALEFLDGRDLAEWLAKEGPLDLSQAISLFLQVTSALEHAHSQHIIHRDIKPGNIIVLGNPERPDSVKVVDFGMARFQLEGGIISQKLSQEGEIFGTRQYISPEQYRGVVADERADIYSLGVTFYESVLKDGKVPEPLRAIISKATETDPTARYQNAAEFRLDLHQLAESLRSTGQVSGMQYVTIPSQKAKDDFFGTFYFWTMLSGLLVVAISAIVVVKQRIDVLESVSNKTHKSALGRVSALSLAATQNQARGLQEMGQLREAAKLYESWLQRNRSLEKWSAQCIATKELASIYSLMNDCSAAENAVNTGLGIAEKHGIKSGFEYADLLLTLAALKQRDGDYRGAIAISKEVIQVSDALQFNFELEDTLISLNAISNCQAQLGNLDEAEKYAAEALKMSESTFGRSSSEYADSCKALAEIADRRKDYSRELSYLDEAAEILKTTSSSKVVAYLTILARKALAEIHLGKRDAAIADYEYIAEHFSQIRTSNPSGVAELKSSLSNIAAGIGYSQDVDRWKQ